MNAFDDPLDVPRGEARCPACEEISSEDQRQLIGGLTFCPWCCRTLNVTAGALSLATSADVDTLNESDLKELRKARNARKRERGIR